MDSDILIGQPLAPFIEHCRRIQATPDGGAVVTLFTDVGARAQCANDDDDDDARSANFDAARARLAKDTRARRITRASSGSTEIFRK